MANAKFHFSVCEVPNWKWIVYGHLGKYCTTARIDSLSELDAARDAMKRKLELANG